MHDWEELAFVIMVPYLWFSYNMRTVHILKFLYVRELVGAIMYDRASMAFFANIVDFAF